MINVQFIHDKSQTDNYRYSIDVSSDAMSTRQQTGGHQLGTFEEIERWRDSRDEKKQAKQVK